MSLFLVNEQQPLEKNRDASWLFQVELEVSSPDGEAIFRGRPRRDDPGRIDEETWRELQDSWSLHRHQTEFAVWHGVSVHADPLSPDSTRPPVS